jgi:UDP-N-acetylmuramoyl-L-alanyl-D-glutamate--2,6-diaminopimelate ligase
MVRVTVNQQPKPVGLPRPVMAPRPGSELSELLGIPCPPPAGWAVTGVTLDSRAVRPGDLYAALPGLRTHGAKFTAGALAAGAAAILTDPSGLELLDAPVGVPVLVVPDPRARLGEVSAWVYDHPCDGLLMIGITGTNGKTTTSYLLDAALRAHGQHTGLIGTVAIQVGDDVIPATRTTPEAPDLHGLLAAMRQRGVTAVTMEVSSHALVMGRVDGVRFDLALFTNFSQDHLDFHGDLESYFAAKAQLFTPERADAALICTDDEWGRRLAQQVSIPVTTYGLTGSPDWLAVAPQAQQAGSTFLVRHGGSEQPGAVALPGEFNVANAVAAVAAATLVGVDPVQAGAAVAACPGVPGRMEPISVGQPFAALVDYAHTPDAVARALIAARSSGSGRVIAVLGCGGDRDREKRPIMGQVAAREADILVITDDNPRSESASSIRMAIIDGVTSVPPQDRAEWQEIPGRDEAIRWAVSQARAGDVLLVAGKGHEQGQEVAGVVHPFDDREAVRAALRMWIPAGGQQ